MAEPLITFTSEQSPTVIVACGKCGMTYTEKSRDLAVQCCVCVRCGAERRRNYTTCEACGQKDAAEREEKRRAKLFALPYLEDHTGPVYCDNDSTFYEDAHAAAERLWDDAQDPETVVLHPCKVSPAPTPYLRDFVDEAWGENFDDYEYGGMPKKVEEALDAVQKLIEESAPTLWTPMTQWRVRVPVILDEQSA